MQHHRLLRQTHLDPPRQRQRHHPQLPRQDELRLRRHQLLSYTVRHPLDQTPKRQKRLLRRPRLGLRIRRRLKSQLPQLQHPQPQHERLQRLCRTRLAEQDYKRHPLGRRPTRHSLDRKTTRRDVWRITGQSVLRKPPPMNDQ